MIISLEVKKADEKVQYSFTIKILKQQRIKGKILQHNKDYMHQMYSQYCVLVKI